METIRSRFHKTIAHSPAEEVIVLDVWNKLRAWKELQMEKFFPRLLLEEPELEYLFGQALAEHGGQLL